MTFEIDSERRAQYLTVYTGILDLLALLGGLALFLHALVSVLLGLLNQNAMENWLVANLFKARMPVDDDTKYGSRPRR